mmetsp:Transcript_71658/g.180852  ORF Transcript_71658/g.180852 Transcript_71658/m.180852 type:complete len:212 (-) Transcript_71658:130-765(-)
MRLADEIGDCTHEGGHARRGHHLGDGVVLVVNSSPRNRSHDQDYDQQPLRVDDFVKCRLEEAPHHQGVRIHHMPRWHARVLADCLWWPVRDARRQRPFADLFCNQLVDQGEASSDANPEEGEEPRLAILDVRDEGPERPPDGDDERQVAVEQSCKGKAIPHRQTNRYLPDPPLAAQLAFPPQLLLLLCPSIETLVLALPSPLGKGRPMFWW